jgi:hypothetical protein
MIRTLFNVSLTVLCVDGVMGFMGSSITTPPSRCYTISPFNGE